MYRPVRDGELLRPGNTIARWALVLVTLPILLLPQPSARGGGEEPRPVVPAPKLHEKWLSEWADNLSPDPYVDITGKPDPQGLPTGLRRRKDGQPMVLVPSGAFDMGTGEFPPNGPIHRVKLTKAFYMDASEVTIRQFDKYQSTLREWLEKNRGPLEEEPELPADFVTWDEAVGYAKFVGGDLPSEAEWEWAAHRDQRWAYPWGDEFEASLANARGDQDGFKGAAPVRSFAPSRWGLYDLCGNVAEWCLDYMDGAYYVSSPTDDPVNTAPRSGARVVRGGSYTDGPARCRVFERVSNHPGDRGIGVGFRCVVRIPP